MDIGSIQNHLFAIETALLHHFPSTQDEFSDLITRIEEVKEEIAHYRTDVQKIRNPITRRSRMRAVLTLSEKVQELSERISKYQLKNPFKPQSRELEDLITSEHQSAEVETVHNYRGVNLSKVASTSSPVALITKSQMIPLEFFQDHLKSHKNLLTVISKQVSNYKEVVGSFVQLAPDWLEAYAGIFLSKVRLDEPFNLKKFKQFFQDYFEEKIKISPEKSKFFNLCRQTALNILNGESSYPKEVKAQLLLSDFKQLQRFDFTHIQEELIEQTRKQLKIPDEELAAFHLFITNRKLSLGNYLTKEEADKLIADYREALKTTYNIDLKFEFNFPPYIDITSVYEMCKNVKQLDKIVSPLLETETVAVAKGGDESLREPFVLKVAEALNVKSAFLTKEMVEKSGIMVKGEAMNTAVVSSYLPHLKESEYLKILTTYVSMKKWKDPRLSKQLEKLRGVISDESYGESLYVSLLFHATDDHYAQFTTLDERLVNFDCARDLPPNRALYYEGKLEILLRCTLLDFPQLEDPLHPQVIEKILSNTPQKMEEVLSPYRISELYDPYQMYRLLKAIQQNPPPKAEEEKIAEEVIGIGNLQAAWELIEYFEGKDPTILNKWIAIAEKGRHYQRNLAVYHLQMYRDFHRLNICENPLLFKRLKDLLKEPFEQAAGSHFAALLPSLAKDDPLKKALEDHNLVTDYLQDAGMALEGAQKNIPRFETDEERKKMDDQILRLFKTSLSEKAIDRMKMGAQRLISKIHSQKSVTGKELAEALVPEEFHFYEAYKDLDYFLPSTNYMGWKKLDLLTIIDDLDKNPSPKFPKERVDQLFEDCETLRNDAGDRTSYYRFCYMEW